MKYKYPKRGIITAISLLINVSPLKEITYMLPTFFTYIIGNIILLSLSILLFFFLFKKINDKRWLNIIMYISITISVIEIIWFICGILDSGGLGWMNI